MEATGRQSDAVVVCPKLPQSDLGGIDAACWQTVHLVRHRPRSIYGSLLHLYRSSWHVNTHVLGCYGDLCMRLLEVSTLRMGSACMDALLHCRLHGCNCSQAVRTYNTLHKEDSTTAAYSIPERAWETHEMRAPPVQDAATWTHHAGHASPLPIAEHLETTHTCRGAPLPLSAAADAATNDTRALLPTDGLSQRPTPETPHTPPDGSRAAGWWACSNTWDALACHKGQQMGASVSLVYLLASVFPLPLSTNTIVQGVPGAVSTTLLSCGSVASDTAVVAHHLACQAASHRRRHG